MADIFISYRRRDSGQIVASIYNFIAEAFGPASIFIDTKGIPDGAYFTLVIEQNIRDAKVMLVIMGKDWLGMGSDGHRRIDEQDDLVRAEVRLGLELARQGRLALIPVLIDDAPMPSPQQLPSDLSDLHWRNAAQIHSSVTYLTDDINRLLDTINKAGVSRRKNGRIEQPPDRFALLFGASVIDSEPGQSSQAAPRPGSPTSPTTPTPARAPTPPPPQQPPNRPISYSPPVRPPTSTSKNVLQLILAVLLELPGLIRGILILAVIVGGIILVKDAVFPPSLTEHSTCQQFEQADYNAQTQVLQQMMTAHGDKGGDIGTTRLSVGLYCNIMGPNAPIDGIYNG
jgi:hypothetical protein